MKTGIILIFVVLISQGTVEHCDSYVTAEHSAPNYSMPREGFTTKLVPTSPDTNSTSDNKGILENMKQFFNPQTCRLKGQNVILCPNGHLLDKETCLSVGCCPSPGACYKTVTDDVQLSLRVTAIVMAALFLLCCVPLFACCCIRCCQCLPCLRRQPKEVAEIKKKQKEHEDTLDELGELLEVDLERGELDELLKEVTAELAAEKKKKRRMEHR